MLNKAEVALSVESEEVGAIGAVAIVGVPVVVVRGDIVAFEDQSSPAVVDTESVDGIETEFDEVDDLPEVVVAVAVWGDDIGET